MESRFTEQLFNQWNNFISGRPIDTEIVRPEIQASWKRCFRMKVDPYNGRCTNILEGEKLLALLERNRELIKIARPYLNNLYNFLAGHGFFIMMTDPMGQILEFFGENVMSEAAYQLNFKVGACWDEKSVGTTTIGVIMHTKAPFQMTGAEHYCYKSQKWTCSAAPVTDEEGNLLGIINVSGPKEQAHKFTLGMVSATAESVNHFLLLEKHNRLLVDTNKKMTGIFETVVEPLILLDKEMKVEIVNQAAQRILNNSVTVGSDFRDLIEMDEKIFRRLVKKNFEFSEVELELSDGLSGVSCLVTSNPIRVGENTSWILSLKTMEKVQKLVRKYGGSHARLAFSDIITRDSRMLEIIDLAKMAANGDGNVILGGESGTGKEVLAQAIHNGSGRKKGPFVAVNCGAIPRELVDSELFGYVEGAFTGAVKGGRPGKFELASTGTIFLDEIGDMPYEQQVALLRVLQEKKVVRIGGEKELLVDVRVICATNKNLKALIERGTFREDLYYRLNVISINIPPLRERKGDIPLLVENFMEMLCRKGAYQMKEVGADFIQGLQAYDWPGNIRELQNIVERVMNTCQDSRLSRCHIPEDIRMASESGEDLVEDCHMRQWSEEIDVSVGQENLVEAIREQSKKQSSSDEKKQIEELLKRFDGNVAKVAREMGISRNTLYRKLDKYEMR